MPKQRYTTGSGPTDRLPVPVLSLMLTLATVLLAPKLWAQSTAVAPVAPPTAASHPVATQRFDPLAASNPQTQQLLNVVNEANRLYEERRYDEAARQCEKAWELSQKPGVDPAWASAPLLLRNLAESYRMANSCPQALGALRRYQAMVGQLPQRDVAWAQQLASECPQPTGQASGEPDPDPQSATHVAQSSPLPLSTAAASSTSPSQLSAPAQKQPVAIGDWFSGVNLPPSSTQSLPGSEVRSTSSSPVLGYTLLGAAAASAASSAWFGIRALRKQPRGQDYEPAQEQTRATSAGAFWALGGLALALGGVGTYLLVSPGDDKPSDAAAFRAGWTLSTTGTFATATNHF